MKQQRRLNSVSHHPQLSAGRERVRDPQTAEVVGHLVDFFDFSVGVFFDLDNFSDSLDLER